MVCDFNVDEFTKKVMRFGVILKLFKELEDVLFNDIEEIDPVEMGTSLPHFGLTDSEPMRLHWSEVYSRLLKNDWLRSSETESGDWVYVCCGRGTSPKAPIVWHGTNAALAYIVRTHLGGNWDVAHSVFCLKDGKELPKSFKSTKSPSKKVCDMIDLVFKKH